MPSTPACAGITDYLRTLLPLVGVYPAYAGIAAKPTVNEWFTHPAVDGSVATWWRCVAGAGDACCAVSARSGRCWVPAAPMLRRPLEKASAEPGSPAAAA